MVRACFAGLAAAALLVSAAPAAGQIHTDPGTDNNNTLTPVGKSAPRQKAHHVRHHAKRHHHVQKPAAEPKKDEAKPDAQH